MFVRKDKDGNLVGVGSIDYGRLAQLQGAARKKSAESKTEPAEPKAEPKAAETKAAPDEPKATATSTSKTS
jgi:hypothetical protein